MEDWASSPGITKATINGITRYSYGDIRVYQIPVENFAHHFTNAYLIVDRSPTLIDLGYNGVNSSACLERGFSVVGSDFGESIALGDVENIVITHGHGDHFGLLCYEKLKGRRVYVHPLDSEVVLNHAEAYAAWVEDQLRLVREAGSNVTLDNPYGNPHWYIAPGDYEIIEVTDSQEVIHGYRIHHFPGHSLGHICIGVGPFLFLGDHILSSTTPHQAPKSGWRGAGLGTYLLSLKKTAITNYGLGLPAHEDVIPSIARRAYEIEIFHHQRLRELTEICGQEKNLEQITTEYYRRHPEFVQGDWDKEFAGSNKVLALEEIKAHLEFLVERDVLAIIKREGDIPRYFSKRIWTGEA